MKFSVEDEKYMQKAIELACKAKGKTFPNPSVGAVIVKNGHIIGKGHTSVWGGPHAEIVALNEAGHHAQGATMYVSLEPCDHFGRTPPCTEAIIKAGIQRVVVASKDPNPIVSGRGLRKLSKYLQRVEVGLLSQQAYMVNEDYFWYITHNRPWISLKLAMTLDGRIADKNGNSKWITSVKSRRFVHELRSRHAAVAIGRNTLEKDNPSLTVRLVKASSAVRIVFTRRADISRRYRIVSTASKVRTIFVVSSQEEPGKHILESSVELWCTGKTSFVASFRRFLEMAFEENLCSILFEGGRQIASFLLEHGFVNRVYLFYGNKIFGQGLEGFQFLKGMSVSDCFILRNPIFNSFGTDWFVSGIPIKQRTGQ